MQRDQRVGRRGCRANCAKATSSSAAARAASMIRRAEMFDQPLRQLLDRSGAVRPRRSPRSAPASTSRATTRRESRRETRCVPCPATPPDRHSQKTNVAGHRPFAGLRRALEHERVGRIEPDGASSFTRAALVLRDRTRTACAVPEGARGARPRVCPCVAAADRRFRRCRAGRLSRRRAQAAADSSRRYRGKALLLPGIEHHHQMPREGFHQALGAGFIEAFVLERGAQRMQTGIDPGHRHETDHRAEHQPFRRLVFVRAFRPGQTPAADQAAIDADRIRPFDDECRSPAAHARPAHPPARPCRHRRCGARFAAARPVPAPPRIRPGRTGRQRPACPRPPRPHCVFACANASPTSRRVTSRNGGGRRISASVSIGNRGLRRGRAPGCLPFVWTVISFYLSAYSIVTPGDESAANPGAPDRRLNGRGQSGRSWCVPARTRCRSISTPLRRACRDADMSSRAANSAAPSWTVSARYCREAGDITVACTQEAPVFSEAAAEDGDRAHELRQYSRECRLVERGHQGRAENGGLAGRRRRAAARHSVRHLQQRRRRPDLWP